MAFEWIGTRDYLGELKRKTGPRTRGKYFTSADFAFRFKRNDGKVHLVLGEWKYTESYGRSDLGKQKPVRKDNYREAFHRTEGVFGPQRESLYNAFFFEPFYQLMRLQLLAQEMEAGDLGREMEADVVSVLHICPMANGEFREAKYVTSPGLQRQFPGKETLEIWKELVPDDKFLSISVEELLNTISRHGRSLDSDWVSYLVLSQLGFGNCLRKRLRLLPFFRSVDVGGWQPWDENGMWSGWKGKNETSWND